MNNKHPYHLVNPSPWPISVSAALLGLTIGGVSFFHSYTKGIYLITFSFILLAVLAGFWWRDLIREGTYLRNHTKEVLLGLRSSTFFFAGISIDTTPFLTFQLNDLELFTSYLFKTHLHYMFLSIFLLLLALFLSVFLSTKFVGTKDNITNLIIL